MKKAVPFFTIAASMLLLIACQSEAEKQQEAQKDAQKEWLEKFGFADSVPEELQGRWVSKVDPRASFVIEAKGDSVVKKTYSSIGRYPEYEECGGCRMIEGLYYDAKHDAVYRPALFPRRAFGFIENAPERWDQEVGRYVIKGDTMTYFFLDRNFVPYPNDKGQIYIRLAN